MSAFLLSLVNWIRCWTWFNMAMEMRPYPIAFYWYVSVSHFIILQYSTDYWVRMQSPQSRVWTESHISGNRTNIRKKKNSPECFTFQNWFDLFWNISRAYSHTIMTWFGFILLNCTCKNCVFFSESYYFAHRYI